MVIDHRRVRRRLKERARRAQPPGVRRVHGQGIRARPRAGGKYKRLRARQKGVFFRNRVFANQLRLPAQRVPQRQRAANRVPIRGHVCKNRQILRVFQPGEHLFIGSVHRRQPPPALHPP